MKRNSEREIATHILGEITTLNSYNNIVLRKALNKNKALLPMQRAFITELVNGTLRNLIYIDYVINSFSKTKTSKMKPLILSVLRISVYQIMFLDKVPNSAICNEAVNLVKSKGFSNLSGFVNGVLRSIIRAPEIDLPNEVDEPIKYLSVKYSYSEWIIKYWLETYSFDIVHKMCEANSVAPAVTICVNTLKTCKDSLKQILTDEGVQIFDGELLESSLRISPRGDITELNSFRNGLFHIMDESSMLSGMITNPQKNSKVFDVCAAPGGKSFYMSYMMNNTGEILCNDIYEHKIELINDGIKRLGLKNVSAEIGDALEIDDSKIGKADYVLIDAPCSGLGIVRKKPDIKYSKTLDEIHKLVKVQRDILKSSSKYVKPGGTLVYSTCTVSKLENENNISWFIKNFPFELEDITPFLPKNITGGTLRDGYVQILPSDYNSDGFFVARFRNCEIIE